MNVNTMRQITIVAQASLEGALCANLREWGAPSYSVTASLNGVSLGCHEGEQQGRHIRIETIVSAETAEAILQGLQRDHFKDCSVVYFVSDIVSPFRVAESCKQQSPREEAWGDFLITL